MLQALHYEDEYGSDSDASFEKKKSDLKETALERKLNLI